MSLLLSSLSFLLLRNVYAIEVTPNSDCSSLCMNNVNANPAFENSSSTQTTQLVCDDWELTGSNSTSVGRDFHDCVECESNSTAFDRDSNENDVYWFLFNMKLTLDWCLFLWDDNDPTIQSRQCGDVCAGPNNGMKAAMVDRLLQTNATLQYQYCKGGSNAFADNVDECISCLQDVPSSIAQVNYLRAMKAACEQQPRIGGNIPIKLAFEIYDLSPASTSQPSATARASSSQTSSPSSAPTVTVTSAPASTSSTPPSSGSSHSLGLGLGLGLGLSFLLAAAAVLFFFLRRRRQRSPTQHPQLASETEKPTTPPPFQQQQQTRAEMHTESEAIPEADSGQPPVPEKDRWFFPEAQSNNTSELPSHQPEARGELESGTAGRR